MTTESVTAMVVMTLLIMACSRNQMLTVPRQLRYPKVLVGTARIYNLQ